MSSASYLEYLVKGILQAKALIWQTPDGCGKVFCDRTNTAFYDLRTSEEKVELALKMAMRGMSVLGIAEALCVKPFTVISWISRAADYCEKVNEVVLKDVETAKVEMDKLWTYHIWTLRELLTFEYYKIQTN